MTQNTPLGFCASRGCADIHKPPQVLASAHRTATRRRSSAPSFQSARSATERPKDHCHSACTPNLRVSGSTRADVAASSAGTSYGCDAPTPYKWSWQEDTDPWSPLELDASAVEAASSVPELTAALHAASAAAPPRAALTAASRALLASAAQRLFERSASPSAGPPPPVVCSVGDVARLLEAYGAVSQGAPAAAAAAAGSAGPRALAGAPGGVGIAHPPRLVATVLAHVCAISAADGGGDATAAAASAAASAAARDLANLLWALSELQEADLPWEGQRTARTASPHAAAMAVHNLEAAVAVHAPAALQRAVLARVRNQDFLAPDLCRVVCALGSLAPSAAAPATGVAPVAPGAAAAAVGSSGGGFQPDVEVVSALNEEVRYQLTEFDADFSAEDLGRLISGMAGLRLGAKVATDEEYRRILMKAVYGKTRSITDKAAVDFSLSRLLTDDPEARSMHYDSRWTHEELRWLPRRERDKRRIIQEGWYRTQWGGWAPGGAA